MQVSDYHRRRWDEPRIVVEVIKDEVCCRGEIEARRRRGAHWQAWVRCTGDARPDVVDTCSGWFEWNEVRVLEVEA